MGKNIQNGKKNTKEKKDPEPESEEYSEDIQADQDAADFMDEKDLMDGDLIDDNSVLLKKIEQKILECDDQEKLSWGAIHTVKQQEDVLNADMQKQIDVIKEKYEKLKAPLMEKITDAVSGKKLDKSIYSQNELIKSINLNKTKPKAIKDYWGKVFYSCGLVSSQSDVEVLEKLKYFKVELVDPFIQHIKVFMQFEQNQFIESSYQLQIQGLGQEIKIIKRSGKNKKPMTTEDETSIFSMLTDVQTQKQELQETAMDLYRAYVSSTYFYFYNPNDDMMQDSMDGQEDEQEEDNNDDDEESEDDVKETNKKPKAALEKPECKNQ